MPINISTSPGFFPWRPACWMRITGDDAGAFLQGQFTNDLRPLGLPGASSVYGLWLTLKGKVLADSFVVRGGAVNEFWIGSYFSPATVIRERLESHVIADDVVVEDVTREWAGVSMLGDGAATWMAEAPAGGFVFRGRRERNENVEVVYQIATGEPEWGSRLPGQQLDRDEMERRRIVAGIPVIPVDVGPADLPNEAGLEVDAISYTKGCYLGQEVMARLKSMGQVRRRLLRVAGAGETIPARPAAVFVGARQVGELRSAVRDGVGGWMGLAMVSRLHVAEGATLALAADAEPSIRLLETP